MITKANEKLREYETIYIVRPDVGEEALARTNKRVFETVERLHGKMVRFDNWGRKKLAFAVAKQPRGVVMLAGYLARDPKTVDEIQRNLRMVDDVVRIHSVRIADEVDPETRAAVELTDDKNKIADVADESPRDEERYGRYRRDEEFVGEDEFAAYANDELDDRGHRGGRGRGGEHNTQGDGR